MFSFLLEQFITAPVLERLFMSPFSVEARQEKNKVVPSVSLSLIQTQGTA